MSDPTPGAYEAAVDYLGRHIDIDPDSNRWLLDDQDVRGLAAAVGAAGVAAGRAQVLAVLRDDALYHEWNRRCGMDPAGPRSTVDAVQRDVMHDFAEWATGGEPRG